LFISVKDEHYMMAPVAGPKWFVGKLSESIHIEHLSIVASEPFSSKPKSFMLSGRAAPIDDDSEAWRLLGVFEADEAVDAAAQVFKVQRGGHDRDAAQQVGTGGGAEGSLVALAGGDAAAGAGAEAPPVLYYNITIMSYFDEQVRFLLFTVTFTRIMLTI
jgi:hypothetical protein